MLSGSVSRAGGGIFEVERQLAQNLSRFADVSVNVFGIRDAFTDADLPQWLPLKPKTFAFVGPSSFAFTPHLFSSLKDWAPDLTHLHSLWMYPSVVLRRWAQTSRKPAMISPHGMLDPWALNHSRWKKRLALTLFEKGNLQNARCIHALTPNEADSARSLGLRNPIAVIPNGVELPEIAALSESARPIWAQGKRMVLFLGRIHAKKGLAQLLAGWKQWRSAEGWVLAIAGWDQGGHEGELKQLAERLRLRWSSIGGGAAEEDSQAADVVFLGPQFGENKARLFRACDAFVLPSFSEGLPMVVLEAWAYRKPVLMTPMCNLPHGFAAGAALRIEPEESSIASGLGDLFALSDHERIGMGERGRRLVEKDFSWPRVAEQMRDVYAWILGSGAKPDCVLTRNGMPNPR